jgi:hypothetical protein
MPYVWFVLETASHIIKCPHPAATANLQGLSTSLQGGTPPIILEAIISGLRQWESTDCPSTIKSPAAGSRLPSLQAITLAFNQQTSIGWDSFHRSHVTSAWREEFSQHSRPKKPLTAWAMTRAQEKWMRLLIASIWTCSEKLWRFRNQVIHGQTKVLRIGKALALLHEKTHDLYHRFEHDPYMLPQSRRYLFNRSIQATLQMDRDALATWIRSVEEGLIAQEHREKLAAAGLSRTLFKFFTPKQRSPKKCHSRPTSIFDAPFSASYYKRNHGPWVGGTHCSQKGSKHTYRRRRVSAGSLVRRSQLDLKVGSKSLLQFGFKIRRNTRQSHAPVGKHEFSGTKVSTAP